MAAARSLAREAEERGDRDVSRDNSNNKKKKKKQKNKNKDGEVAYNFPTFAACSWNVRSMHATSTTATGKTKRKKLLHNISELGKKYDAILLQETKNILLEDRDLGLSLPNWSIFHSNHDNRKIGGVTTCVSPNIKARYEVKMAKTKGCLKGRVLLLRLSPKDPESGDKSVVLGNVYLSANSEAERRRQLDHLTKEDAGEHNVFMGDWNTILKGEETSGTTVHRTVKFREAWDQFLAKFRLSEVDQPLHTRYNCKSLKPGEQRPSSKLDRMFTSLSEIEQAICAPNGHIAWTPQNLRREIKDALAGSDREEGVPTVDSLSDHLPIGLNFPKIKAKRGWCGDTKYIPRWVAGMPRFKELATELWEEESKPEDPFMLNLMFDRLVHEAAKQTKKELKNAKATIEDSLGHFCAGMSILTATKRLQPNHESVKQLIIKFPEMGKLVDCVDFHFDTDRLEEGINKMIHADVELEARMTDPRSSAKQNTTSKLKILLPSSRKRLQGLRATPESAPTYDPKKMAMLAKGHYGTLWAKRSEKPLFAADQYLRNYEPIVIPEEDQAVAPTLESITKTIMATNNSCAGPNGVPFQVHRVLCDIYAPIAESILKKLGQHEIVNGKRVSPDEGFNLGRLFLIPKEGNGTIDDTRPISVTNASNRIVAKCLAASILPVLQRQLHHSQKGYLNDRDGGDHIRDTNEEFYQAVQSDGESEIENYILFMDYKKAFDSVDHDFLMCMMAKLDLPQWFQCSVWGLLQNVHVSPACGGAKDIWIAITRGMKQGCPLSPLLFAICYDPLLRVLDGLEGLSPRAFADDLACSTNRIVLLYPAMTEIDLFETASGLAKNIKKTKVLCANNREQAATDLASSPWPELLTTEVYKYLGILMGAGVTLEDVFRSKVDEIWQLTLDSLPALRKLKREDRIKSFNIFAYPKLVYLMGFFPFPESAAASSVSTLFDRARRIYTTRFYGTAYPKEISLTGHDDFGFKPAVKDPWTYSIANLTNQDTLHLWDGTDCEFVWSRWEVRNSMRIADQVKWCTEEFVSQVVTQESHIRTMAGDERPYSFNSADYLVTEEAEVGPPLISKKKTRGKLYSTTLKCAYRVDYENKMAGILKRRKIAMSDIPQMIQYLHSHQKNNKSLNNYLKNILPDLICNSLVTERRRLPTLAVWSGALREDRLAATPNCFLCLGGMDSAEHLYSDECPITREARALFFTSADIDTSSLECSTYNQSLLLFNPVSKASTQAISIFNAATWITRTNFFKILDAPLESQERINRLAGEALSIWRTTRSSKKKSKNKPREDIDLSK
jgi:exonuclease III